MKGMLRNKVSKKRSNLKGGSVAALLISGIIVCIPTTSLGADEQNSAVQEVSLQEKELEQIHHRLLKAEQAIEEKLRHSHTTQPVALAKPVVEKTERVVSAASEPQSHTSAVIVLEGNNKRELRGASSIPESEPASINVTKSIANEMDALQTKNAVLRSELQSEKENQEQLRDVHQSQGTELKTAHTTISSLRKEIQSLEDKLLMAEAEVERLSSIIQEQQPSRATRSFPAATARFELPSPEEEMPAHRELLTPPQEELTTPSMPIATVAVEKANLRTGPGLNNSPLMAVSKGTRLVIEERIGEWYRIVAPTGERAWISSEVVLFGKDGDSAPTRTLRIQGIRNSM